MWENFKHKSVKVKRKLNNMDQVMNIEKLNKVNFLKKEVEEFGREIKNADRINKRIEYLEGSR